MGFKEAATHIGPDLNTPSSEAPTSFQDWMHKWGFSDSTSIFLALCLSFSSPSTVLQAQEGPSHVSVAVWHMLYSNPSCVCCRYGGSPRQITDVVVEVTQAGVILMGGGEGDVSGDTLLGPPLPPGLFSACLMVKVPDPGTPSCELAGGEGRREFCLLALSFDEGEACVGQTSGNRCWWRNCQDCVEGKGVMHMLLDTGRD